MRRWLRLAAGDVAVTSCIVCPVFKRSEGSYIIDCCYASIVINGCVRIDGFQVYPGREQIFHPGQYGWGGRYIEFVQFTGGNGQVVCQMIYEVIREALERYFPGFTTMTDNPEWHTIGSYRKWKEQLDDYMGQK